MKVTTEVRDVLKTLKFHENIATMPQMDRALYVQVNKVLGLAGGKWNRGLKGHTFEEGAEAIIADVIDTGEITDWKKEFQFFETPPELAKRMVEMAEINEIHDVLEPSAGKGKICQEIMARNPKSLTAVELNMLHLEVLNKIVLKGENVSQNRVVIWDFLSQAKHWHERCTASFDVIVANPPFRLGQDVKHVMAMWDVLRPGGRLVAITSPGWMYRSDTLHTNFRQFLWSKMADCERLPEGTFKGAGTNVSTMLIRLEKP